MKVHQMAAIATAIAEKQTQKQRSKKPPVRSEP